MRFFFNPYLTLKAAPQQDNIKLREFLGEYKKEKKIRKRSLAKINFLFFSLFSSYVKLRASTGRKLKITCGQFFTFMFWQNRRYCS